jgi:hypothetical protein
MIRFYDQQTMKDLSRNPWKAMRAEEIYLPETAQFERNQRRQISKGARAGGHS